LSAEVLGQHVILARAPGVRGYTPVLRTGTAEAISPVEQRLPADDWLTRLEAPGAERLDILIQLTRAAIAATLRVPDPESIDCRGRLIDLGLDSLMAVELRNRMGKMLRLDRQLRATLVFEHPTAEAIAEYLYTDVLGYGDLNVVKHASAHNTILQQLQDLTEEDAEALLLERLKSF
jgi:hypothetical protein